MKAREFWVYRSMSGYDDMVTPFVPKENWEGWSEDFIHVREVLPDDELEKLRAASKVLRDALSGIAKEAEGFINCHEAAISMDHGNSNMAVMGVRIKTAHESIAKFAEMMGGEEG